MSACEDAMKAETKGAKALFISESDKLKGGEKCIICGMPAAYWIYAGKSY
jgi:hypothetical protein